MGLYGSVKGYIQRRKYQRIDESIKTRRRRLRIAKMGGGRRRRIWRLKLSPRLKLRWFNPKVLLMKLRDAYVKMMLSAANSRVFSTEMMGFYGNPFGQRSVKEYDPKMLIELYKSYMVQEQGYMREMQSQVA